jgi:hypothetical protein
MCKESFIFPNSAAGVSSNTLQFAVNSWNRQALEGKRVRERERGALG